MGLLEVNGLSLPLLAELSYPSNWGVRSKTTSALLTKSLSFWMRCLPLNGWT